MLYSSTFDIAVHKQKLPQCAGSFFIKEKHVAILKIHPQPES
jgi:hypothetical protein